jgi:hypothetical protein
MSSDPESSGRPKRSRKRSAGSSKAVDDAIVGQNVISRTEVESKPRESPEEIASRLRREAAREAHELFKEKSILVALLITTAVVRLAALAVLAFSDKPNLQSWATAALSSMLAGYFGWLTGKGASIPKQ